MDIKPPTPLQLHGEILTTWEKTQTTVSNISNGIGT